MEGGKSGIGVLAERLLVPLTLLAIDFANALRILVPDTMSVGGDREQRNRERTDCDSHATFPRHPHFRGLKLALAYLAGEAPPVRATQHPLDDFANFGQCVPPRSIVINDETANHDSVSYPTRASASTKGLRPEVSCQIVWPTKYCCLRSTGFCNERERTTTDVLLDFEVRSERVRFGYLE
jgi:hypothetical protein